MSDFDLKVIVHGVDAATATIILREVADAIAERKEASVEFSYEKPAMTMRATESTPFSRYINSPTVKEE